MLLIGLGCMALAAAAAAQPDDYTCFKTKDLKQPQFAGSTAESLADEFRLDEYDAVKKAFLHCKPTLPPGSAFIVPDTEMICYKVKGSDAAGGSGTNAQPKTYVLCVPPPAS
jgi:hypothetical protein